MEVSIVRNRIRALLDRSKRPAEERRATRRAHMDAATQEYDAFLERVAVPLFKQIANVLRVEGHQFDVFTPGGSVRLMASRGNDDYIELLLDTNGDAPKLLGRISRSRAGNVSQTELVLNATADIADLTDEDVLAFVLSGLEGFVGT
jgi:hypothetical protein